MTTKATQPDPLLISYLTLRKAIGFLGISIPAVMMAGTFAFGGCAHIQSSISHYYYTMMGDVFVGMLCATGIFLITYKGYDLRDNIVSFIAGVAILCVALFPTSANIDSGCVIRTLADSKARTLTHYISAGVFYLMLAYISFFLFTKTSGNITPEKLQRNRIYRVCGVTILIAIALILAKDYIPGLDVPGYHLTFWFEWLANLAYGISWLVKGEFLLKDKPLTPEGAPRI